MKYYIPALIITLLFASCKNNSPVVTEQYADSLISNYVLPQQVADNQKDMIFWKKQDQSK